LDVVQRRHEACRVEIPGKLEQPSTADEDSAD